MAKGFLTGQNKSKVEYQYPSDWINIDDVQDGCINLLVGDGGLSAYAFYVKTDGGQYSINWGDGTTTLHDSATICQHTYTVGSGMPCANGYSTFKIVIAPTEGSQLTEFRINGSNVSALAQSPQLLACVMNVPFMTTLANCFYISSSPSTTCKFLESIKIKNAPSITSLSYSFCGCYSLKNVELCPMPLCTNGNCTFYGCQFIKSIDITLLPSLTISTSMFMYCYRLENILLPTMIGLFVADNMFSGCWALSTIDISIFPALTNASYMFNNCYALVNITINNNFIDNAGNMFNNCSNLASVNINSLVRVLDATRMFFGCTSLKTINAEDFAKNSTSVNGSYMFNSCEQLENINIPKALFTRIACNGTSNVTPNKLKTLNINPLSSFSGGSPQVEIRNCTLSASQLNAIFTTLPTVTGKTINITGCTGATTCDRTIATTKGWTVTG